MKISKKIFAILLAVVLTLSIFAVSASAAGTAKGDEWMTVTITTDKGVNTCSTKETVKVTVSIACNYNVPTFRFPIMYDKSVFQAKTLLGQEALGTCATAGTLSFNKITDGSCIPENYDADQFGCILFQWVANTSGSVGFINNPEGEAAFSFELETTAGSAGKTGSIFIPSESNLFYYMAIEDPDVATSFYYLTADTCAMSFVPANVTVAAADVALIPNAAYDSKAVIDEENLCVYGLGTGMLSAADVKEYVAATGGATIRVSPNDMGYGTGSKINLQLEGNTVKSYTMIIFGDLDGDGDVNAMDATTGLAIYGGSIIADNDYVITAGDIGIHDQSLDAMDVTAIIAVYGGSIVLDQSNPYAA